MAYDPTIPALNNYVGDDIPKIMANFAELAGSRIVDHNLDVSNPPNGHYVRFENGWQICFGRLYSEPASTHWNYLGGGTDTTGIERQWTPPAAFSAASGTHQDVMLDLRWGFAQPFQRRMSYAFVTPTPISGTRSIVVHFTESVPNLNFSQNFAVYIFAIGRWK